MLVLTNLPPETSHIEAESETYRVPINKNDVFSARHVRITLAPGQTNRLELKLEPVGADYIGTTKKSQKQALIPVCRGATPLARPLRGAGIQSRPSSCLPKSDRRKRACRAWT